MRQKAAGNTLRINFQSLSLLAVVARVPMPAAEGRWPMPIRAATSPPLPRGSRPVSPTRPGLMRPPISSCRRRRESASGPVITGMPLGISSQTMSRSAPPRKTAVITPISTANTMAGMSMPSAICVPDAEKSPSPYGIRPQHGTLRSPPNAVRAERTSTECRWPEVPVTQEARCIQKNGRRSPAGHQRKVPPPKAASPATTTTPTASDFFARRFQQARQSGCRGWPKLP